MARGKFQVEQLRTLVWIGVISIAVCACAILGMLQFHWLDELSQRERETRQVRLSADAQRFSDDFDRELTEAYFAFQLSGDALDRHDAGAVMGRFKLWSDHSAFPHLIRDIWMAEQVAGKPAREDPPTWRFLHLDPRQRRFVEVTQPSVWGDPMPRDVRDGPLDERKMSIAIEFQSTSSSNRIQVRLWPGKAPVSVPIAMERVLLLELDLRYMVDVILPALVKKYFGGQSSDYQAVVVREGTPQDPIYISGATKGSSLPKMVDATAPLFGIRRSTEMNWFDGEPVVVEEADTLGDEIRLPHSFPVGMPVNSPAREYWRLMVTHRTGSLEQFAKQTRSKNLFIGVGILGLLAVSLVLALATARRAYAMGRQQVDFVASVSHELRTPLTTIGVAASNLADGVVSKPRAVRSYGLQIRRDVRRLSDMLENVLSYARVQSLERTPRETVAVEVLVLAAVRSMQPRLDELGFNCILQLADTLPPVQVDSTSIEQAIQNLVVNAIKYSGEHREIRISTGENPSSRGQSVWIAVSDLGIGIPEEEHALVFEPFRRGRFAVERRLPGTGLGLALVHRVLLAHGGSVRVRSSPGNGSTFTLYLPAVRSI